MVEQAVPSQLVIPLAFVFVLVDFIIQIRDNCSCLLQFPKGRDAPEPCGEAPGLIKTDRKRGKHKWKAFLSGQARQCRVSRQNWLDG